MNTLKAGITKILQNKRSLTLLKLFLLTLPTEENYSTSYLLRLIEFQFICYRFTMYGTNHPVVAPVLVKNKYQMKPVDNPNTSAHTMIVLAVSFSVILTF